MVLKNLVRYIINKYLKDYIEELDYEKVQLDLKNGHVCLEKLHLKPEALADLSIPVTVSTGFLEKLILIIPWTNLYSNPTKVYIDGLYLLIVPKNEVPRDLTEYYDDKMQRVQRKVDNLRKAALGNKKPDAKETTFFERMRLQIMQNLEITVRNLHISYETISTTKLGHPFSFGLTLHQIEMITTTNHHTVGRMKENSLIVFKMKEMRALSLYWNTKCKSRINMLFDDVVNDLKSKIATTTSVPNVDEMNYILHPVTLNIDLILALRPGEYNFERVAYDIDIKIEQIALSIDPKQFSDLLDFIKFQNYSKIYDRCREYRELQLERLSNDTRLTSEQMERIKYLESKLDVFNLAYIRHNVEMETGASFRSADLSHHHRHHNRHHHHHHHNYHHHCHPHAEIHGHQRHSIKTNQIIPSTVSTTHHHRWWNSWWKTKSHSKDERRKSSVSISDTAHNNGILTEDSLNIDIKVKISNLVLNLSLPDTDIAVREAQPLESRVLCPIKIIDARIDFKRRAISSNILFKLDLQTFSLFGMQNDSQHRPLLVTAVSSTSLPLIQCELEFSPIDKTSDYRLFLNLEPLKITYDAPTINKIVTCFDPNDDNLLSSSPQVKQRTLEEMEADLSQDKIFDMTIQLKGISLILPEGGALAKNCPLIHIDLNKLVLKACLQNKNEDTNVLSQEDVQKLRYYNKYDLGLSDLQINYSRPNGLGMRILTRIPVLEIHFYKCIYSNDADLVDWRIVSTISKVNRLDLSKAILTRVMHHLQSVPLLYSSMMETLHRINLYFIIFPPHTTVEVDVSIHQFLLLLTQIHTWINTDIHCHILKTRKETSHRKNMRISLNNIAMSHQTCSKNQQQSSHWLIYHHNQLNVNYSNNFSDSNS